MINFPISNKKKKKKPPTIMLRYDSSFKIEKK